jgi:nicotinamidase-related amidase
MTRFDAVGFARLDPIGGLAFATAGQDDQANHARSRQHDQRGWLRHKRSRGNERSSVPATRLVRLDMGVAILISIVLAKHEASLAFGDHLDAATTAVVLIDLQNGVMVFSTAPHAAATVVKTAAELAARFRGRGAAIVYVRVDLTDLVHLTVDQPSRDPNAPPPPAIASELVADAGQQPGDLIITKRYWDAFVGTDLEQKLRERNVRTILLGGIATNFGVESTARTAAALGFDVVLVEDAVTTISAEAHQFAISNIFPRLGRVRTSSQLHAQ